MNLYDPHEISNPFLPRYVCFVFKLLIKIRTQIITYSQRACARHRTYIICPESSTNFHIVIIDIQVYKFFDRSRLNIPREIFGCEVVKVGYI
jgi:hypothetical protein